ncbi:Pkinase and DUF3635 domain containing protein [Trichuris trichiura]|uniref:Pkinase and DUF3635 domain containing protein n=1 Tax=Trichuris trichiura TaxID=36087 RepID=A0A077ZA33_TRITR|nr:Pkinase and DUF3635 domain containing protein [Trichuris trichiura]
MLGSNEESESDEGNIEQVERQEETRGKHTYDSRQSVCDGKNFQEIEEEQPTCSNQLSDSGQPTEGRNRSATYLEEILQHCGQTEVLTWKDISAGSQFEKWEKIGEGAFSEVFLGYFRRHKCCIKIIPINGPHRQYTEVEHSIDDVVPEIAISFVRCLQGKYPRPLQEAWDMYASIYSTFKEHPNGAPEGQLYLLIFMEHVAITFGRLSYKRVKNPEDLFKQLTVTLYILEKKFKFEHRDLHVGNILMKYTRLKRTTYAIEGQRYSSRAHGLLCYIMDYGLSRFEIGNRLYYTNLPSDSEIIEGSEDHAHMLPLMRDLLRNSWAGYNPKTNVLWIAYLIDAFANGTDYLGATLAPAKKERLLNIKRQVEQCNSSEQTLLITELFPPPTQFVRNIRTNANLRSTR